MKRNQKGIAHPCIRIFTALILMMLLLAAFASCGAPSNSDASQSSSESSHSDEPAINEKLLVELLGEEEAEKLIEGAETSDDRHWIATHPEEIDFEGETVQWKLLTLAADEDEAVSFVRNFADRYPEDSANGSAESALDDDGNVPHLYQWDKRWGYTVYSSTAFGLTGCGPTAFAMVYQGVTGKHDKSPYDMGLLAQKMGYMAQYEGTATAFLFDAASNFNFTCTSIPVTESSLKEALRSGAVVIANVGHGYFSHFGGHYLVLTGIDSNGKVTLNDPYSAVHSQRTWDIDFILGETMGLYAFTK